MKNLNKTQKILFIFIIVFIICVIIIYVSNYNTEEVETFEITNTYENIVQNINDEYNDIDTENKEIEKNKSENEENIVVHISGCVKNEGIVELKYNSRVKDAIDLAGGLTKDADLEEVNLAYKLEDGMKIHIPSYKDKQANKTIQIISTNSNSKNEKVDNQNNIQNSTQKIININTATQAEFETLPGIGPSIASKIVKYREENGKFSSIEDLKEVSGVGEAKFEKIKKLITIK